MVFGRIIVWTHRLTGKTKEEAALSAMVFDGTAGAALLGVDLQHCSPQVRGAAGIYGIYGGGQAIGLSTAFTVSIYGSGASASAITGAATVPLLLSGIGGFTVGTGIDELSGSITDRPLSERLGYAFTFIDDATDFSDICGC